jgi:glucose-6-phosphate isomerase
MSNTLRYDATAALSFIEPAALRGLKPSLEAARAETIADVADLKQKRTIPADKQPLDSGFIELPSELLAGGADQLLDRMLTSAKRLREQIDILVSLGIGGSYMGLRAIFEAVCHPYHNDLARADRGGAPRLYFEGDNVDNDAVHGLLQLLSAHCKNPQELAQRWGICVISKSGGTLETAAAFRIFRAALESYYGAGSDLARNLVVPITGETGKLRDVSNAAKYPDVFPIPDGVGGRFSVMTAVGLYPAAVLGVDIRAMLQGAADMTERFKTAAIGDNPVMDYVAVCHLLERDRGMKNRILSTWGKRLEAVGLWYDQLLAESLGKHERGAFPLTVVNTRDLHSRGQQHQEGARDKLITNLIVEKPSTPAVTLPKVESSLDHDKLNIYAGKTVQQILTAATNGTNEAYAEAGRPTANLTLPGLDAYALGQVFQFFMLATVVEGRLIGVNPYGQPGVEAYKKKTVANLGK